MEFSKEIKKAEFLNPRLDFRRDEKLVEFRSDPLTGYSSRVSVDRAKRVKQAQSEAIHMDDIASRSAGGCFFCPENIDCGTTRFMPGFLSDGKHSRIKVGECTVFPNLHPFTEHHAVATLGHRHCLDLDEFTTRMVEDNLTAACRYIAFVKRCDHLAKYPVWMWNHLPPSGASMIHPHTQISVERAPLPELKNVLHRSRKYLRDKGKNFWQEIIESERKIGERFIGENTSIAVIASFSPRGNRDIQIISKRVSNLADFDVWHIRDFADAVVRVLRGYKAIGMNSFNLVTYSDAAGVRSEYFRVSARIISRPVFQPLYTNDSGPIERFYGLSIIEVMPEQVASDIRKYFDS